MLHSLYLNFILISLFLMEYTWHRILLHCIGQCLLCLMSGRLSCLVNEACLSCLVVWVLCTLPGSCIRSLTIVKWNCWYGNFEQKKGSVIKLLRMVRSRRWENNLFVRLLIEYVFCHVVRCVHIPHVSIIAMWLVSQLFHAHHRNYSPVVKNTCLSVCITFIFPFILWLSSYLLPYF